MSSTAALVLVNLIPLAGVAFWGWRVLDVVLLYWFENLVIGAFNALAMLLAGADEEGRPLEGWIGKLPLVAFFLVALACHSELADLRPPAEGLTESYLWLSAGGAVGGLFNALGAPLIFVNPFEYPLAAISSVLLLPGAVVSTRAADASQVRRIAAAALTVVPVDLVVGLLLLVQRFSGQISADVFSRYAIIFVVPPAPVGLRHLPPPALI